MNINREKNLKRPMPEQARERGRKGGLASGRKRRELRDARQIAQALLALPLSTSQERIAAVAESLGINTKGFTQKGLVILAALLKAQKGDTEATKLLLSLVGELPATKQQTTITGPQGGPLLVMGAQVTAETLQRARQIAADIGALETAQKLTS